MDLKIYAPVEARALISKNDVSAIDLDVDPNIDLGMSSWGSLGASLGALVDFVGGSKTL